MKTFKYMKNLILLLLVFNTQIAFSQNFITKNGRISFFSKTSIENIDAVNNQAVSILNSKTGELVFSVLINGFLFKKALMQEHFNENYMESTRYPKALFNGKITDMSQVNFARDGSYTVTVSGDLTMHGVTRAITTKADIKVSGKKISAQSSFSINPADFNISIPKVVENNIAKTIDVKIDCKYTPK